MPGGRLRFQRAWSHSWIPGWAGRFFSQASSQRHRSYNRSVFLFFFKDHRFISYFLYFGFLLDGYGILIDPLLGGVKNGDLALIYTFLISIILVLKNRYHLPIINVTIWYLIFLTFLICSALFSYIHYDIPLYHIIQGGRSYLLILSLPILINVSKANAEKLIRIFSIMTIAVGIVDLLQIIFQIPLHHIFYFIC